MIEIPYKSRGKVGCGKMATEQDDPRLALS